ncbi:ribonuclease HII [Pelagibaculum spongiae]|uniref:Ribonuclease HII n=1 Tax=Pelagibaculum spongiae TaxID=2080658 RepID=A0A2V1GWH2_9GAMM|nr:ribonuclease HII [Pelagibaculum spongiae]PVZ64900.1 ribonuclease HII [Pelagibaculum spongiae]
MLVAGVDEVGRGPLAGPVVTAAVILDPENPIEGLRDSKKLSEKKRELLFDEIREKALSYCVARCELEEIETLNILHATMLAMQKAVAGLTIEPELVLIDGNRAPELPYPSKCIIGGDDSEQSIAAASILAKVTRDREMVEMAEKYPGYGFEKHKGYGTKQHMLALDELGICDIHRRGFKPIAKFLNGN